MRKTLQQQMMRIATVVAIVVIALCASVFRHPIDNQLNSWKLLPQPEKLTELYFTKPNSLPASYSAGQTQTVSFTIHNLEYKTVTYHYTISQVSQSSGKSVALSSGSVTLAQNGYAHQSVPVTLSGLSRSQVAIELTPTNESIDYWINGG